MPDFRCANPAYQRDVDDMVLDYLLYKCIEAQLRFQQHASTKDENEDGIAVRTECVRLLGIFDTFMQLYKINHADKPLPENMPFNVKVLEFLAILGSRGGEQAGTAVQVDAESIARFVEVQGGVFRRRCQQLHAHRDGSSDQEAAIRKSWEGFTPTPTIRAKTISGSSEDREVPLFMPTVPLVLLTPVLLELAAETVAVLDQTPNELFLELAAHFMLRAALEILLDMDVFEMVSRITHHAAQGDGGDGDAMLLDDEEASDTTNAAATYILTAFAWGGKGYGASDNTMTEGNAKEQDTEPSIQQRPVSADSDKESETLIASMFRDASTDQELDAWTSTRQRYLSYLGIPASATRSTHLAALAARVPEAPLRADVLRFVEGIWRLVGSGASQNAPVLIQIERGRLEGLDEDKFEAFMRRVGGRPHLDALEGIVVGARGGDLGNISRAK